MLTCWEKRPAGAARAPDTAQMLRMASSTDTRPDLGASGFTIACNIKNFVYILHPVGDKQLGTGRWHSTFFISENVFVFRKTWRSLQSQASCCLAICLILNCRQLLNGSKLQMKESRLVIEDQFVLLVIVKSELGNGFVPFSCQCWWRVRWTRWETPSCSSHSY